MKTNNRLSKDNNTHEQKVRPMVKVIETRWSGKDNGIIQTEGERPMNEAEYIEYLEEQVTDTFSKLVSVEELSKQTISTLEKENQELKEENSLYTLHLSDRKMTKWESKVWDLISNKYCSTMGQYSLVGLLVLIEKLDNKVKTQQDQFLKVVDNVLTREHYAMSLVFVPMGYSYNDPRKPKTPLTTSYVLDKWEVLQEIKNAIEKGE